MRKLILKMSMSLDGFVGGPNGEADWMLPSRSEDGAAWVLETLQQAGVHAMGSRTYRAMASYWPTATDPMATAMNDIPKVVFTRQASVDLPAGPGGAPAAAVASWASARIAHGQGYTGASVGAISRKRCSASNTSPATTSSPTAARNSPAAWCNSA
jgi:hypothetical protein